jgi:hypothetical protein
MNRKLILKPPATWTTPTAASTSDGKAIVVSRRDGALDITDHFDNFPIGRFILEHGWSAAVE